MSEPIVNMLSLSHHTFTLSHLHTLTLSQVKHKEVIEARNNRGVPDAQIARQSWEDHKKRNDSIIIDWFQVCG